jgi:hypothetical protein
MGRCVGGLQILVFMLIRSVGWQIRHRGMTCGVEGRRVESCE